MSIARVLGKVYANYLYSVENLQSPDVYQLMDELVGLSSWFWLNHKKEESRELSTSYNLSIDPNGIKGNVVGKSEYFSEAVKTPNFGVQKRDASTDTVEIYKFYDIEKAVGVFSAHKDYTKKRVALMMYLRKYFPPNVKG